MTSLRAAIGQGLTVSLSLAVLLAYSWAEGVWTGRWQPADTARLAAAKLKDVPMIIGAWQGTDGDFDERQIAVGELDGYLHRVYTNVNNGQQVQILVVCGRPGPISVHTPDVCYRGLGFTTLSRPLRKILAKDEEGTDATCWTADFQRPTMGGKEYLRIAWTWFAAGAWHAADRPRLEFAREPVLFKTYLIHGLSKLDTPWDDDPLPQFSQQLLPVLASYLVESQAVADNPGKERLPSPSD